MQLGVGGLLLSGLITAFVVYPSAAGVKLPDAEVDDALGAKVTNTLVVAGGCFWGIEEVFQHVKSVTGAVSGYSGGSARAANYEMVSTGASGHAESVKVSYDPSKVTIGQLLKVFFSVAHDPTLLNRQGPDHGPQYRSAVFVSGERQHQVVKAYIDQLGAARVFRNPIVTEVAPLTGFYQAEDYHQDYASKNPLNRYILINDAPKVVELRAQFPTLYR
jgi:peptide-methionine (S)-S-oxide reductase